jgi:hypothetical protein
MSQYPILKIHHSCFTCSLPFIKLPIEKRVSALTAHLSDITPILTGAKDPFLYNPRKALTAQVVEFI